jgi:hypothetical protein
MTRSALIDCTLGPLQWHAEGLLWEGRRESTKVSFYLRPAISDCLLIGFNRATSDTMRIVANLRRKM